nr:hypothetical protein [Phascolarctobacterium faecium]
MSQFTEISENSRQKNLKPMEYPRSILSVEDFPAKTLAQQVKELVSLIVKGTLPAPVFGESMPGLFASLNQDGLWLKTWQGYCQSLLPGFVEEDSELYSETWTKWGIVLDGHAMELPMLERHINESECLLWHTSDCSDRRSPKSKQQGVNNQVKAYWRTPQSHNGAQGPKSKMFYEKCLKTGQSAITLVDQVKNWTTPAARDSKGSNSAKHLSTGHHINQLANKVKLNKTEGQLNADWVELLMGLPIGWTDINVAKEDIESWQGWPAAINVEQYAYEPPRVIVGQKNRAKRLKALGNGCVPQQVYLVLAAIVEVENEA